MTHTLTKEEIEETLKKPFVRKNINFYFKPSQEITQEAYEDHFNQDKVYDGTPREDRIIDGY